MAVYKSFSTSLYNIYPVLFIVLMFQSTVAGNLHFANILLSDGRNGHSYICVANNVELRHIVQGDDQILDPVLTIGTFQTRNVTI